MAKTAEVLIDGEVGYNSYMASIAGVRDQLTWQGEFDDIRVVINSCGGDIAEGLGIYDLLRSYAVPITTVVIGQCCSAATIVFLAGKTRLIYENVVAFMVHQASGGGQGTADELRTIADFIDSYNERMATIYIEATGKTAEQVAEWMSKDSFMTAEEALMNGFATAIAKPVSAKYTASVPPTPATASKPAEPAAIVTLNPAPVVAQSTPSTNPNFSETMNIIKDKWERISASMKALLGGAKVVAKKVTTDAGDELTIETADGGDNYAEGDSVKKGEEVAPDGTYVIGNVTMVVKDGKIESLKAAESADTPTASGETEVTASGDTPTGEETIEQKVARLESEKATLSQEVTALKSSQSVITAKMTHLLGSKESKDVKIPAPKPQNTQVSAKSTVESDEDTERNKMLEERRNRGLGITPAA